MRTILNNPYRIVGLLAGSTAKEQHAKIKRMKMYVETESDIPQDEDFSFPALGPLSRTMETVNDAASKINLDNDKMNAALFWFYNGNEITDEPAFDALKEGDIDTAVEIWTKLTDSKEITQRNSSAFQNLSTLLLCLAFKKSPAKFMQQGLELKIKFLESDYWKNLKALATDETYKTDKTTLELIFIRKLQADLENAKRVTPAKMVEMLSKMNFTAKAVFMNEFAKKLAGEIEQSISEATNERKNNQSTANKTGEKLYKDTEDKLIQLKNYVGTNNLTYTSVADSVAQEILQCSIDYYNHYKEDREKEWLQISIPYVKKLKKLLDVYDNRTASVSDAKLLLNNTQTSLQELKVVAETVKRNMLNQGAMETDLIRKAQNIAAGNAVKQRCAETMEALQANVYLYIKLMSTIVADNALQMIISSINASQDSLKYTPDSKKLSVLNDLKREVDMALNVINIIEKMDLQDDFKKRLNENKSALSNLQDQLRNIPSPKKTSGCYMATMAYGDYNHPQVMELRRFRDNVLAKSVAGNLFIDVYYAISPKLVELLNGHESINVFIRKLLNQFIKLIK